MEVSVKNLYLVIDSDFVAVAKVYELGSVVPFDEIYSLVGCEPGDQCDFFIHEDYYVFYNRDSHQSYNSFASRVFRRVINGPVLVGSHVNRFRVGPDSVSLPITEAQIGKLFLSACSETGKEAAL